ncbi:MAG: hypothetical protein N5P05_004533 (plasmid) [Chroococcopsis gigantea SAG 12.99]|jgi:hypothetical protein|nr:hypothetical protein [Chroococcopsis gigantea SAG 12.99]
MTEKESIDTIYDYTESHLKALEESLTRLDNKFSTFIGFSSVLIRLVLDLPKNSTITIKILTCALLVASIVVSAVGLKATKTGRCLHPAALMEDKYFEQEEVYRQCLLVNDRIELIDEYEKLGESKGKRFNWVIGLFVVAITLYGVGVSGLDTQFKMDMWWPRLGADLAKLLRG